MSDFFQTNQHISLIGFMGSGKSTVGKQLSLKLKATFVDLDRAIEDKEGFSVSEIFEQKGELYFRQIETKMLDFYLSHASPHIISTGGGTPCSAKNIELILQKSFSVFLNVEPIELYYRLMNSDLDKRPLLRNFNKKELQDFIIEKTNERLPFYSKCKQTIEIGKNTSMKSIIDQILKHDDI